MKIGERIRQRRKELGLTQLDLAKALKVTPQHVSVIEKDKRVPSLASLVRLAEELGVTLDYLVAGKESVITDSIPAIKADTRLSLESKRAIVTLVEELHQIPTTKRE